MAFFNININTMKNQEKTIQELKEKYGVVYALPVDDKTAYLREPNMIDYKRAFAAMQTGGELGFSEDMLKSLFIGGDEDILTNDDYFLAAKSELSEFFKYDDATISTEGAKSVITIAEAKCVVKPITREHLRLAEKKNPGQKPFVTQEQLFDIIVLEKDQAFDDKNNAAIRFPLYQAIEKLQKKKVGMLKKL